MLKLNKLFIILFIITIFSGCSSVQTVKREPIPELKFNRTPRYTVDLSGIEKPSPLNPVFGFKSSDGTVKECSIEEANVVILTQDEYRKVAQLVILATSYKKIVEQQEVLVNNQIEINNSLKEFVELERLKSKEYQDMWIDSENTYLQEKQDHKSDNVLNKIVQLILTGALVAIAI